MAEETEDSKWEVERKTGNKMFNGESGTSASSPVFGAMVTLWNDMRLGTYVQHGSDIIKNDLTTGYN